MAPRDGDEQPPRLQWRRTLPGRDLPRLSGPAAQQRDWRESGNWVGDSRAPRAVRG